MEIKGWPLNFFNTEDWVNVQTKLDFLEDFGCPYNPARIDIFRALELLPCDDVRVSLFGMDPYPNPEHATGVAFETESSNIPGSLHTLLRCRRKDLGMDNFPSTGSLRRWVYRGVLLWNVTPTVEIENNVRQWRAYSHEHWPEWKALTSEIVRALSDRGERVFVFFGRRAQQYAKLVDTSNGRNSILEFTHPSPVAQAFTQRPLVESRLFSTINERLVHHGRTPIDWSLD